MIDKLLNTTIKKVDILPVITTLVCVYTLHVIRMQVDIVEIIILAISVYISSLKLKENWGICRGIFDSILSRGLLVAIIIYITFTEIGGFYLFDVSLWGWKAPSILYFVLCLMWMTPVVLEIITLIEKKLTTLENEDFNTNKAISVKCKVCLGVIALVPALLYLYAYNPCITTGDDKGIWNTIHMIDRSELIDWIPPFYLLLLSGIIRICDSITFIVFCQILLWCFTIVEVISVLSEYVKKELLLTGYVFTVFNYCNIIQMITAWKDAFYVPALLLMSILIAALLLNSEKYSNNIRWYIEIVISAFFTAFMRQSGVYVVIITFLCLAIIMRKNTKIFMISILIITSVILIKIPVYKALDVKPQPQLKFLAMGNDICYVYYNGGNLSDDGIQIINEITCDDPSNYSFNAYNAAYNSDALWDYSIMRFTKIYIDTFLREPVLLTKAILTRTSISWSIDKTLNQVDMLTCYTGERLDEKNQFMYHYPARINNKMTFLLDKMHELLTGNSILFVIFWRVSPYFSLIIIELLILGTKRISWRFYLPYAPVILNYGTLIITSAWADFRYFWPNALLAVFLSIYFVGVIKSNANWGGVD